MCRGTGTLAIYRSLRGDLPDNPVPFYPIGLQLQKDGAKECDWPRAGFEPDRLPCDRGIGAAA